MKALEMVAHQKGLLGSPLSLCYRFISHSARILRAPRIIPHPLLLYFRCILHPDRIDAGARICHPDWMKK